MSRGRSGVTEQGPWIGVVPVEIDDSKASTGNQESFADTMVNKVRGGLCSRPGETSLHAGMDVNLTHYHLLQMKRALVLGASALIIFALNQNTYSEVNLHAVSPNPGFLLCDLKSRFKAKL